MLRIVRRIIRVAHRIMAEMLDGEKMRNFHVWLALLVDGTETHQVIMWVIDNDDPPCALRVVIANGVIS